MLRQELQETRESLAARDAEVEELRSRLAELEQLQQQQQQLIELKDSELAAVQQRLAESNQQEAPTLAQANQDPAGGQVPQDAGMPWLWIGLALVLVIAAALAWARTRRDRAVVPAARGAAPAAAGASAAASAQRSPTWHAGGGQERVEPQVAPQDRQAPQPASDAAADEPATAPIGEGPRPAAPAFPPEPVETPPSSSVEDQPSAATVPPVELDAVQEEEPAAVGDLLSDAGERLELAKAYAELGDVDTARALLEEVARERDTPESSEAARLLSELA